jgi:predicted ATPase/class 3 adenylate cyclase
MPTEPRSLPTGTVTFLRTDVEGSMNLARALGAGWDALNEQGLRLVRAAIDEHGGVVVRTEGDAVFAAFQEAGAGVRAAVEAQRALRGADWPADAPVRVRMGLHSGEAHLAGDDYGGFEVSRAARVASAGHGGQIVLSGATQALVVFDLPPDVALRDLGTVVLRDIPRPERLYQVDVPGLPTEFPPPRAGRTTTGNLDVPLTTFVGREALVAAIAGMIPTTRLLTLTGPGGIGKSRLALETARAVQGDFVDGAWFVPLESVADAEAVPAFVARTIGLFDGASGSASELLPRFVADRSLLFVLDNVEQVVEAAPFVADLVRWSPASRVVVTSRTPLRLTGEQEYPVPPLDGGRALFLDRARAVRPDWDPGREVEVVDEICALVDGLPLGIELAAARVALLPLTAIRDRLAASVPLPGAGSRDAPARQRTLDATVAWSHDLLDPRLQRRLRRFSVFEGGADIEQAQPVLADDPADDVLDDLAVLAERSLVERDPSPLGIRFRMLRTIQTFAAARLAEDGEAEAIHERHAEAFLALAREAQSHEGSEAQSAWIDRLSLDSVNLRAATSWALEQNAALALRLVAALWRFWQMAGHLTEGRDLTHRALAHPDAAAPTVDRMWALGAAGSIAYWQADSDSAHSWYAQELALARELGDERGIVDGQFNLGHTEFIQRVDIQAARALLEEVQGRYRALGDERGVLRAEWAASNVLLDERRNAEALALMRELLGDFERLGDAQYHAMALGSLAWASFLAGETRESIGYAARAIRESYDMRDLGTTTISLHVGVLIALIIGRADVAARLTGAFEAGAERYGVRPPAGLDRFLSSQDPFQRARDALSPEAWATEYDAGRRMTLGDAVELVEAMAAGG